MADHIMKSGDTYPPLTITLDESTTILDPKRYHPTKADGTLDMSRWVRRVDLFTTPPDSIRMIAKLSTPLTTFDGPMQNVEVVDTSGSLGLVEGEEPGLNVPVNRGEVRYPFSAGDTDVPGTPYNLEVEVTWDDASTPPKIETYPNASAVNPTLEIDADLD